MRLPILLASAAALAIAGCDYVSGNNGGGQPESSVAVDEPRVVEQLREALKTAPRHGLTIDLFLKGDIESAPGTQLRDAVVQYASALAVGKVDPAKIREVYTLPRPKADVKAGFEKAMVEDRLGEWLDSLAPQTDEYRLLSRAFVHYAGLASKTPDTNLPLGKAMKQGESDPRVPALVDALKAGGYMQQPAQEGEQKQAQPAAPAQPTQYSAEVAAAVKRMQEDFGLKADGVVGNDTLKAVNTSAKDRARQLAVALERLRWLERNPPANRIDVNTAATVLTYYRDGQAKDRRRVVVGEPGWETPQLGSPIFALVANPNWVVPDSIAEEEISQKSGAWLSANGFVRKDGRWVQQPGPKNSLGDVKFAMRNDESIYLHDTPATALFAEDERHRSHGCIRVQNAEQFAAMIAADSGITEQFAKAMAKDEETQVELSGEIPVRLMYHTAFVGPDGKIGFVDDVYGWDNQVAEALGYEQKVRPQARHRAGADIGP